MDVRGLISFSRNENDELLLEPIEFRVSLDMDEVDAQRSIESIENGKGIRCVRCGDCFTGVNEDILDVGELVWAVCYHCRTKHTHGLYFFDTNSSEDQFMLDEMNQKLLVLQEDKYHMLYVDYVDEDSE